jgi:hypothetical protein
MNLRARLAKLEAHAEAPKISEFELKLGNVLPRCTKVELDRFRQIAASGENQLSKDDLEFTTQTIKRIEILRPKP